MYSDQQNEWGGYTGGAEGQQQPYYFYPQQQQGEGAYIPPSAGVPLQQHQNAYGQAPNPQQPYFNPMGAVPGMAGMNMNNFNPVITNFAKQYGESLVGQGKEMVDEKLQKFVTVSKLKYYFAVDTAYVAKKMGLIFFPFTHKVLALNMLSPCKSQTLANSALLICRIRFASGLVYQV
jgi:hypothetical protein